MRTSLLLLLITPFSVWAQQKGIDFVQHTSWEEIKSKAKSENKNILVDCFTSWCVPCKVMEREVFRTEEVGGQVNPNFVSLQLQFDIDTLKNPENKNQYALSNMFHASYKINGYPTVLFLDAEGHLLYQFSGLKNTVEFLKITASVSAGKFQYEKVRKRYKENPNDLENLYELVSLSIRVDNDRVQDLLREYLTRNQGMRTQRDAQLVHDVTNSSANYSFGMLKKEQKLINGFLGQGASNDLIRAIVYHEEAYYTLGSEGALSYYIRDDYPNWESFEEKLKKKHPDNYADLMDYIKLNFFQVGYLWDRFSPALSNYITRYGETVSDKKKMEYATTVAKFIDDRDLVTKTLNWTAEALEKNVSDENMQTLKTLREKSGKIEE